jgi:PAS domain S-box-containing protein
MNTLRLNPTRLRRIELLLLAAQLTVLVAGFGVWTWRDFSETGRKAEAEVDAACSLLEEHVLSSLAAIDGALLQTADLVAETGMEGLRSEASWHRLRSLARPLPPTGAIFIYAPDGHTIAASMSYPAPKFNASDREYFQDLMAGKAEFFIGKTLPGRTVHNLFFPVARSVKGPDGGVQAVVHVRVDVSYLANLFRRAELAWGKTFGLYRLSDGAVVDLHPMTEQLFGESIAIQPFFFPLAGGASHWNGSADHAGERQLISAHRVSGFPLILTASMPHIKIFEPARERLLWHGVGLLLAAGVLTTLGAMLLLSSKREAQSRQQQQLSDQALRESETRYRALFDTMTEGFALHEIVTDELGRPYDYRFLDVNPAFERLTGLTRLDLVGRRVREVIPSTEAHWIESYGAVALTGEPAHFENFSSALDRWYEVFAYRPVPGQFAVVFTDITPRRRAEETLRKSEARYRELVQNANSAIIRWKADGAITFFNEYAQEFFGWHSDEVIGRHVSLLLPEQESMGVELTRLVQDIVEHPERFVNNINENICRDGRRVWMNWTNRAIRDESGLVTEVLAIGSDITERRRMQEMLRESEERLRLFIDHAPAALAMFDREMHYIRCSRRWLSDYHLGDRDLTGLSHYEVFPEISEKGRKVYQRGLEGEIVSADNDRFVRADGSVQWLRWEVRPWHNTMGEVGGIVIFTEDSTDRKRSEQALLQSRADLDRAQEVGQIGSWRLDVRRNQLMWSAENHRIFGVSEGTPLSYESFLEIVHPDDRLYVDTRWKAGLSGEPYDIEHRLLVDGQVKWVREKAYLEFDDALSLLGGFGITQDITERKRVEQELRDSEERLRVSLDEKEVLLKEIHHRVKNNMQVICSLVSLQAGEMEDDAMRAALRDVTHRVRSMALVHEKLYQSDDLSRIEFSEYARSLLNYIWRSHGTGTSGIRFALELEPVSLSVNVAVPCGLILNELVTNALKHAFGDRPEGVVTVSLQRGEQGEVRLRVCDNGTGLPPGFDWTHSRSLGLRLVQMLAGQLHAKVEVSSHEGTEFSLTFGFMMNVEQER